MAILRHAWIPAIKRPYVKRSGPKLLRLIYNVSLPLARSPACNGIKLLASFALIWIDRPAGNELPDRFELSGDFSSQITSVDSFMSLKGSFLYKRYFANYAA